MNLHHVLHPSPVGPLRLTASDAGLHRIDFPPTHEATEPLTAPATSGAHPVLREAAAQLDAYFAGRLREFDLPLVVAGTPFQRQVWTALRSIAWGQTRSYAEVAAQIGRPSAVRAVGAANGRNPLPIVVPCHRVIGRDGSLTGFAGGLACKRALLQVEGWTDGKVGTGGLERLAGG